MLYTITAITPDIELLVKDDPVRPEIPLAKRINHNSRIYLLKDGTQTQAITCVKFLNTVPATVEDLVDLAGAASTAVFYTIWSYASGAGRLLLQETVRSIQSEFPSVTTYVTLSPKTEMARKFHLNNGAQELRENLTTINYIYK
jgi:hypothetical protein